MVALVSVSVMVAWGLNLVGATWKGDNAKAVGLTIFVGAFVAAAVLLPPIAVVCDLVDARSRIWIAATSFVAFLVAGLCLTKNRARCGSENAGEFSLFILFCAGLLPVLIGCMDGWDKGIKFGSPWLAGRDMVIEAKSGFPSPDHAPWILFWILTFGAGAAFLLRATHKSLDHHFERVVHT
jgi:hypothetical protein